MKDFYTLFISELKRIYSAEKQTVEALSHLVKAASAPKLKETFQHHLDETKNQVKRLETIATELEEDLSGNECDIMKSLLKDADKIIKAKYDPTTRDAALIIAAQRIEHYEIATYGSLKAFAKHFKLSKVEKLLAENGCFLIS